VVQVVAQVELVQVQGDDEFGVGRGEEGGAEEGEGEVWPVVGESVVSEEGAMGGAGGGWG